MPDASPTIELRVIESLSAVDAEQWDACALAPGAAGNPFLSHRFLKALEESKSVGRRTGWQPQYLLAEAEDGTLLGCVPLYLKGHSQGEYVFDHGWAQAFERAGGRYYPKLQAAVPFTPVPCPRLFVRPGPYAEGVTYQSRGSRSAPTGPDAAHPRGGGQRSWSFATAPTPAGPSPGGCASTPAART